MKTLSMTALAAALSITAAGVAVAEEQQMTTADIKPTDQGVLFVNDLGTPIVDAFARPREQCELYLCDDWRQLDDDKAAWALSAGKAAAMGMIFSTPDGQPRVCQWELKIVTEDAMSYEFEPLNVCVPDLRNRVAFKKDDDGKGVAVQSWEDAEGAVQSAVVSAR